MKNILSILLVFILCACLRDNKGFEPKLLNELYGDFKVSFFDVDRDTLVVDGKNYAFFSGKLSRPEKWRILIQGQITKEVFLISGNSEVISQSNAKWYGGSVKPYGFRINEPCDVTLFFPDVPDLTFKKKLNIKIEKIQEIENNSILVADFEHGFDSTFSVSNNRFNEIKVDDKLGGTYFQASGTDYDSKYYMGSLDAKCRNNTNNAPNLVYPIIEKKPNNVYFNFYTYNDAITAASLEVTFFENEENDYFNGYQSQRDDAYTIKVYLDGSNFWTLNSIKYSDCILLKDLRENINSKNLSPGVGKKNPDRICKVQIKMIAYNNYTLNKMIIDHCTFTIDKPFEYLSK